MERLIAYFKPNNRIARRLRRLQSYAGEHDFTVAVGVFGDLAKEFEQFDKPKT